MSTDNLTINQNGGVTRVSHGAPSTDTHSPLQNPSESSRVSLGTVRHTLGETPTVHSAARYTVGSDIPTGSVMATLQTVNGRQTVELVPGVPGSRTHIRQAITDGLVEPLGNGEYKDKGDAADAPKDALEAAPEDAPVDHGKGVFNIQDDEDWAAAIEPLEQSAYDATAASVTVAVLSGSDNLDRATANLVQQSGMSPELAANFVETGYSMYENIVATAVSAACIQNKGEFYSWLKSNKGRDLQHAIQSLTQSRDVSKFRTLAAEFSRHNSSQAQALKSRMR